MRRKILVVEDEEITLGLLTNSLLENDYNVLVATNGKEALSILEQESEVSAILLDIMMPVMDGYEVLKIMRSNDKWKDIPVIVQTVEKVCEKQALDLGANDYIVKPLDLDILLCRLNNIIQLRENAAIINAIRRDPLTDLYSRSAFFEIVEEMVSEKEPGHYVLSCFDIEKFKVVNDLYGTRKGDKVLKAIGGHFIDFFSQVDGVCCRVNADNFAILYPAVLMDSDEVTEVLERASTATSFLRTLTFSIGRYVVEDKSLSPSAMYDRAMIAKATIKGRYDIHVAEYDESMRKRILSEQEIVSEMKDALAQKQFEVWYQPQYNHENGALIGSEALVRWRHPEKGLIPPGVFIPIFEQNGFVYEIDKFVWEESCVFLRELIDSDRRPIPISVNISRYDIFQNGLTEFVSSLIKKYDLTPDLLRLEITESAFTKSTKQIIAVVEQFKADGFIVEIDDFGSGYSSLNTLKDVPADVLKLDMKFLEGDSNSEKGGNIVASIVSMARWIGMIVIAEGVETIQQANFLKSIGCCYIQGYLYSKPLPKAEYEIVLEKGKSDSSVLKLEHVETYDIDAFWNPSSMETLIFNSFVGGACIFEYHNENVKLLRINEKYVRIFGGGVLNESQILKMDFGKLISKEDFKRSIRCMNKAIATMDEVVDVMCFKDMLGTERVLYVRATMRVVAKSVERYLFYCVMEDITNEYFLEQQRIALEHAELMSALQMQNILKNVNLGIFAIVAEDKSERVVYTNEYYYEICGYKAQNMENEHPDILSFIIPKDYQTLMEQVRELLKTKGRSRLEYRIRRADGRRVWIESSVSISRLEEKDEEIVIFAIMDVREE